MFRLKPSAGSRSDLCRGVTYRELPGRAGPGFAKLKSIPVGIWVLESQFLPGKYGTITGRDCLTL